MPTDWQSHIRRAATRWLGAGLGPGWVVAVSGGGDSIGLLRVLHALAPELGLRLSVAHLDHGARGDEARRDAEFVEALAGSLGLPCDLGRWQPARPTHFEADARRARYDWLARIARDRGAAAVAVGHTRDDQAETVLHRILRGTGPRGLAGIPSRRALADSVALVRPLLRASREEVRAYLAAIGQPFREDATNADLARTRSRIRHDLLPRLAAEYNPRVVEALVRLGALAAASERGRSATLRDLERAATVRLDRDAVVLDRAALLHCPPFVRAEVVRRAWRRAGWPESGMSARRWVRLARLARSDCARASVGGGVEIITDSKYLTFQLSNSSSFVPDPVPLAIPGAADWPGGRVVAVIDPNAPRDETIDLDRLAPPLFVRAPSAGDRFEPLGMEGRSTSLNDFFRGRRVARDRRAHLPLVCDQEGIAWVVGHRIADRVRQTDQTRRTVGLRWVPQDAPSS